ncbi:DUF2877 domain-containing protein [Anaerocolumna sp.]|uniref:DUF2877 domain-containing protein n=1 Tax=Anaerocolumna sp. TaxID=2041569 RepID=UPI0028A6B373|nr:DUF2877 domain-containing protein [Anaerocolumna sp.]
MKELKAVNICGKLREALLVNNKVFKVHSVFDTAVNIVSNDIFFTLLSDIRCLYPMSCRVLDNLSFTKSGIRESMEVISSGNSLIIPNADMVINLKDAVECDLLFMKHIGLFVPKDLRLKIEILKSLIWEKGCEYDLSTLVTGKYKNPYSEFIMKKLPGLNEAIKKRDSQAGEHAEGIAGCGIGLTPSSDDMLMGYMSACLADTKAKGQDYEEISKVTYAMGNKASERTNTISGAFLKQCAMGLLSEDMTGLLCTIYSDTDIEILKKSAECILNFGSTSGIDMLAGVVLAIVNLNGL